MLHAFYDCTDDDAPERIFDGDELFVFRIVPPNLVLDLSFVKWKYPAILWFILSTSYIEFLFRLLLMFEHSQK